MPYEEVKRQAELLAKENKQSDPAIIKIYWFPDDDEVRLVELHLAIPPSDDGHVHPFFFRPSPSEDLPAPSAVAMIRPNEFGNLQLPTNWGDWSNAVKLDTSEG